MPTEADLRKKGKIKILKGFNGRFSWRADCPRGLAVSRSARLFITREDAVADAIDFIQCKIEWELKEDDL